MAVVSGKLMGLVPIYILELFDMDMELTVLNQLMDDDTGDVGKLLGLIGRNTIPKINQFSEVTVANYTDTFFRYRFRMSRSTVEILTRMIGACPEIKTESDGVGGHPPIPVEKQTLILLWYLGNIEPYTSIGERFGIAPSAAFNTVKRVSQALVDNYVGEFIKWPTGNRYEDVMARFEEKHGIPGVVGAIDGTHIPIKAPTENQQDYINRKKFHSIILQAICDSEMIITDAFCRYPGRCHDARVFRNSPIYDEVSVNRDNFFPGNSHLIGDSVYPLLTWLLAPFKNFGNLTRRQRSYNYKHSSTRMAVEHCFGTLKGQFRRLQLQLDADVSVIPVIVLTTCILHNLAILNHEEIGDWLLPPDDQDDGDRDDVFPPNTRGIEKRQEIMQMLA